MTTITQNLTASNVANKTTTRLASIDVMRGIVMLIMLLDHVRERFYYHRPVADPMSLTETEPELFFTRLLAHLCAPLFVFLTGLSAWLYANPNNGIKRDPSAFLLKRGLFLIFIEVTLINLSWFGKYETLYLQVIWAIGLSMIALALLCKLPRNMIAGLGLLIVFGHNLLTPINFAPGEFGYIFWTILHDAGFLVSEGALKIKLSYPVLPWIGVILLGYAVGPIFGKTYDAKTRRAILIKLGASSLGLLMILRGFNIYGETLDWQAQSTFILTIMDFFNFSKYPPSLHYILMTLGLGMILLPCFEKINNSVTRALQTFGSAPMFFYILHLYVLLFGYRLMLNTYGSNYGDLFALPSVDYIWLTTILLATALYLPVKTFANYKHNSQKAWLKYL
ncbi:DUF1624 domain-containing protein [Vibrio neonatus]|uniref:DUF1624 domain-containing protein n=1 Tax=Vibrio neonatus TaxID=278860 RepID=UPI0021C2E29F|nr:heparan-alpha-glucosaminide N-acetyltransferase domain-containing protein [Vibrio neonatus]